MTVLTSGDLTQENYFDYPAINASGLNQFLNDGAAVYWAHSPFNPNKINKKPTDAMILGNAVHCLLLEGYQVFKERYAILPEKMIRNDAHKAYQDFCAEVGDKIIITSKMEDTANTLVSFLMQEQEVVSILSMGGSSSEVPIIAEIEGIECKIRIDRFIKDNNTTFLVLDYKTTEATTQEQYRRSSESFGYHLAAAWYTDVIKKKYGDDVNIRFAFIVQNKTYPEIIGMPVLENDALDIGRSEYTRALKAIKHRLETNYWRVWDRGFSRMGMSEYYRMRGL